MMQPILFAAQSVQSETETQATCERLVNMYPEVAPQGGKAPVTLRSAPGITSSATIGTTPIRDMFTHRGSLYLVTGSRLYRNSGSGFSEVATVADDEATYIAAIGDEVCVVSGGGYVVYNQTSGTATTVSEGAFTAYGSVAAIDGFAVLTEADGTRHQVSGLLDATTIDGLDFASAEQNADKLLEVLVDHDEIWFFGEETIEIWSNVGGADYPFAFTPGGLIERGIKAKRLAAKMDNSVFIVGDDSIVYRFKGISPQRISTHTVEQAIKSGTLDRAFVYEAEGHKWLVLRFTDRPAWCFDAATGVWHERATGTGLEPWEATCSAFWMGAWYVGTASGSVGVIDTDAYQDFAAALLRRAQSRNAWRGGGRFTINAFGLQCEMGRDAGDLGLRFSRDVGRTWSRELFRSLGATGLYDEQIEVRSLGQSRNFAARIDYAGNAPFTIYSAAISAA